MAKLNENGERQSEKLQIFFTPSTLEVLEEIGEKLEIKRTDVVKMVVKQYVDDYRKNKTINFSVSKKQ